MSKQYLVSLGGLIYLPGMPDWLTVSIPATGKRYEITDVDFVTGREYDQSKFVSRKAAEGLAQRYPDMWKILTSPE